MQFNGVEKKGALTTDKIWGWRERVVSKMTPKFCAVEDAGISSRPMRMIGVEDGMLYSEWIARNSVSLSFSLRLLRGIQC